MLQAAPRLLAKTETISLQGFIQDLFWQAQLFRPLISFYSRLVDFTVPRYSTKQSPESSGIIKPPMEALLEQLPWQKIQYGI
jgi:hypothetical protein